MVHTVQRTTRMLWIFMLLLFCVPLAGRGSDVKGNYVALGFGSESCQTFLQARSNGLDLPYRHWLTGYLTAVNKLTKDTVDMRGTTDIDGMLGVLEQYCLKHPLHSFSRAVEALIKDSNTLYKTMDEGGRKDRANAELQQHRQSIAENL
jgi:hypothetical protein